MLRKKKVLIVSVLVACLAMGYLIYVLMGSSLAYYSTVSELKVKGSSIYDRGVRVGGEVSSGSVEFDPSSLILRFRIADNADSLPVVYTGVVPDSFKDGAQVVIEGELDSAGVLHASTILTKCPSKYEAKR